MRKHHKPDIEVIAALTAAIAATDALPHLQQQLTDFAVEYQQGRVSQIGVGLFSRRISHAIYQQDYQVPAALLGLLSLLNQRTQPAQPGWS